MKPSILTIPLLLCAALLPLNAQVVTDDTGTDAGNWEVKPYSATFRYRVFSPVSIITEHFSLVSDSGSLKHDLSITLSMIPHREGNTMPSDMENVSLLSDGVRVLPNGEHFSKDRPALISLSYDPTRIPMGYSQTDVFTYYNDGLEGWHRLERASIDTIQHIITSYTTHFTDFANAVIKVPDMPESRAFVPTAMTDLPDINPMQGIPMIEAPTVNNKGTAELTYPIELPKGRQGMQPNIDLHYSSAGSNGVAGVGWNIFFPAITIDTRWGVPRYDPQYESEQYLVNGAAVLFRKEDGTAITLPYQYNSYIPRQKDYIQFYARDTKNQDRIVRVGTNPTDYWWAVTDKNGITTYYGRDASDPSRIDESSVIRTDSNCIAYWAATMRVDVYGNYILYNNIKDGNNIYVSSIDYTGNYNQEVPPLYNIKFNYKDRTDVSTNGRLGVLQTEQKLLCNILVRYRYPDEPDNDKLMDNLAAYYMCYNQPDEASIFKSRLEDIVMLDSVHYIMPEELENCDLQRLIKEGAAPNTMLLQKLAKAAEEAHNMELLQQLGNMMHQHYGENSIPASSTHFTYANAPSAENLFQEGTIHIPAGKAISGSSSTNWGLGGTFTVGPGSDVATTFVSGGANYTYSRSNGKTTSMLIDLNGDGLTDWVYEKGNRIYYRSQRKADDAYLFDDEKELKGVRRLSHEVTSSHTWGLQLSFGADLSYTNPISNIYTDTYFSDINADGLPDLIDGDSIYINQLVNGEPVFGSFSGTYDEHMQVNNNKCENGIIFDGEVDEHIECDLQEILVESYSLEEYFGKPANWIGGTEEVKDDKVPYPEMRYTDSETYAIKEQDGIFSEIDNYISNTPEIPAPDRPKRAKGSDLPATEDSLIYRIEGDRVNGYKLEYVCHPVTLDPKIEVVRVWVAPRNGHITITDSIALLEDASDSRSCSRTADGVLYTIQLCDSVNPYDNRHLRADNYTLLHQGAINANDTVSKHWEGNTYVKTGDIIMFRLRSGENNLFDKTHWRHIIRYDESEIYDSERDYLCTGDGHFQAYQEGDVILTFAGRNDGSHDVNLTVRKTGRTPYALDTMVSQGITDIPPVRMHVEANDSIFISLGYDGNEPYWGEVHLIPQLQYISDFPIDSSNTQTVHDTVTYYPDIQITHSSFYPDKESPYRQLFGPLHKGWGEFAYQNISDDIILLDSLENTQLIAAEQTNPDFTYVPDTSFLHYRGQDSILSEINSTFSGNNVYNPVSESHCWVPMRADSRTEQWIAYGNLGAIGRSVHSNAREITIENDVEDIVEYDSSLPFVSGETRKNNFVRKRSLSIQHSISLGAIVINESFTFGSYSNIVDYMDMNGDGFPDFVGKDGIQYSMPWGGIGVLQKVKNFSPFKSKTNAAGLAFSASSALLDKIPGNSTRDGKFHLSPSLGASQMDGSSSTRIQFMDVNADGLPDKIDVDENTVCYNLGYQFSEPYPFYGNIYASEGTNQDLSVSGGLASTEFSIAQISISGGVNRSRSTSRSKGLLIDINGDGLPDKLMNNGNGLTTVVYNKGNNNLNSSSLALPDAISSVNEGTTSNISTTASATAGVSVGVARLNFGIQVTPWGTSESTADVMLTDMDGDGLVDWVKREGNRLRVLYNKAGHANLLTAVTNPTGQRIELEYSLSEPSTEHRSRQWNLSRIKSQSPTHPMQGAQESTTEVEYKNAYYDNYERTDYGYEYVRTVTNEDKVNKSVYHNRSFLQNGELVEDSTMDANGNMYIRRIHGLIYRDISSGDEHDGENGCDDANTRVAEEGYWTEYYEKEKAPQIVTRYTVQYDERHNMVEYADYGDVADPDDDWRQEVTYLPNTANNMISLPKEERVFGAGQLLRSAFVNYSGYGEPAHINFEDKKQGIVATTHLRYDNFGNIVAIIAPEDVNKENNWSAFDYDSITFSNVVAIHNPFKAITRTEYDYSWGVPIRAIDPAGNEMRFKYDYKGRLSTVLSPIELEQGKEYTVKYEYNLINHNLKMPVKFPYTYVVKDMFDSLFVQREVAIYDGYGRMIQKKHFAEVNGQDEWVVDGAEEWDAYGRAIMQGYPFVAQREPQEYEPVNNAQAIIHNVYDVLDRPVEQTNADGTRKTIRYHFYKDMKGTNRFLAHVTDENGIMTATFRSPQGRLIQQIAGDKSATFFEYSPIGELLRTTDAEGYQTVYSYDMLGRMVSRTHPDAGETKIQYDLAGNIIAQQTANLSISGESIQYKYDYGRLAEIHYPHHPENDVRYFYDLAGRVSFREDGTGSETFLYDKLGNLAQSLLRIVIPTEQQAYMFRTLYKYDSFGRMRNIIYPDGEVVHYNYTTGGLLKNVAGLKNGDNSLYLWNRLYDEQGRKIFQQDGNGVWTTYAYDSQRQWLSHLYTELPSGDAMQNLHYIYDPVGNIITIDQSAPSPAGTKLGGPYDNHYQYDQQYRLEHSDGGGAFPYALHANYSPSGRLGGKFTGAQSMQSDLLFGYDRTHGTHQPRTMFDPKGGTLELFWDANGNLAQIIGCKQNSGRLHEWDEENRLRFVLGEKFTGYYGYNADGERVYKLTGQSILGQVNSGSTKAQAIFDDVVLYPNPYMVVTRKGYTKHYYAGMERIATVIGGGGFGDMVSPTDKLSSQHDQDIVKTFYTRYLNYDPFFHQGTLSQPEKTEDIHGNPHPELEYQCTPTELVMVDILNPPDILLGSINQHTKVNGQEKEVYFYHGDHLGSANWITDYTSAPIQYIHYAPYGELIDNQVPYGYDERFKFTGKRARCGDRV